MPLNAILTNSITNSLHALFLFLYFTGALMHYLGKNRNFSIQMVLFFLTLFILKVLGVYSHYYHSYTVLPASWIAISLLTIMLNYLVAQGMIMPDISRITIVFISIASSFLFLTLHGKFIYIALPALMVYLIATYYAAGMLRVGFVMVVISNITWIAVRQIENYIAGHEIPIEYRYDNDMYHLLLIISVFIIYKAIVKGYWKRPIS